MTRRIVAPASVLQQSAQSGSRSRTLTLTSTRQITLRHAERACIGAKLGDKLELVVTDGQLAIRAQTAGSLRRFVRPDLLRPQRPAKEASHG